MHDRFERLHESLLCAGVSARIARRAVAETADHHRLLIAAEMSRGANKTAAHSTADALIGPAELLVQRYAAQPELRTWCSRWPALIFTLSPLAAYLALGLGTLMALSIIVESNKAYLHRTRLAPQVTHGIEVATHVVFLFVLPSLVAVVIAALAYRRRIDLKWPVVGIGALGVLAAVLNVDLVLTGGAEPGYLTAGFGWTLKALAQQPLRIAVVTVPTYASMWLAARRWRRSGPGPVPA